MATGGSSGNAGHAGTAKRVQNYVAWTRVGLDECFDSGGRDLGVIGVGIVDIAILASRNRPVQITRRRLRGITQFIDERTKVRVGGARVAWLLSEVVVYRV
jgi:hypothetical protein